MAGLTNNYWLNKFCQWCGLKSGSKKGGHMGACQWCKKLPDITRTRAVFQDVSIGVCHTCFSVAFDTWVFCPSCGTNHQALIARETHNEKLAAEYALLQNKAKQMAKLLAKHKSQDVPKTSCSKIANQSDAFDLGSDTELSLLDDSMLSQDTYQALIDNNEYNNEENNEDNSEENNKDNNKDMNEDNNEENNENNKEENNENNNEENNENNKEENNENNNEENNEDTNEKNNEDNN